MPPPPLKKSPVYWLFTILLVCILAGSLLLNVILGVGLASGGVLREGTARHRHGAGEDEFPRVRERWSYGSGRVKAVRIALEGPIMRGPTGGFLSPAGDKVERVLSQIRAASADDKVRAIIIEIDSPGGAISPSDEIYDALRRFRASREDRRVIAHTRDMAASGGYYVAVAADWIVAEPTAVVGSIGVIMQALNWKDLSDRIGITATTIKSGENKDILNPFREVQPGQVDLLQDVIDEMYARFRSIVGQRRGLDEAALATLADGRIFAAGKALEHGLIDQVGYWGDVVAKTAELLAEPEVRVVRYAREMSLSDFFSQAQPASAISSWLSGLEGPQILYLWKP